MLKQFRIGIPGVYTCRVARAEALLKPWALGIAQGEGKYKNFGKGPQGRAVQNKDHWSQRPGAIIHPGPHEQ